jgi:hypothetical protein
VALLKRNQILDADDMKTEIVPVPEWGGEVCIKMLTGKERDAFEASTITLNKKGQNERNVVNLRARLLVQVIIDPEDNNLPLFNSADIVSLGNKSSVALDRVWAAAQKLNSVTEDDVQELAAGFVSDPSESSTSE